MGVSATDTAGSLASGNTPPRHDITPEMVRNRIALLANEIANIALELITDRATIDNELQMQSVAFVELQVALEDEYEIELDPIHMVELNQFDALVKYVYEKAVAARA